MTKREQKYLFIINVLCTKIHYLKLAAEKVYLQWEQEAEERVNKVVEDTNSFLNLKEEEVRKLVLERDENWLKNLETIWQEKEQIESKLEKQKKLRKERKLYKH